MESRGGMIGGLAVVALIAVAALSNGGGAGPADPTQEAYDPGDAELGDASEGEFSEGEPAPSAIVPSKPKSEYLSAGDADSIIAPSGSTIPAPLYSPGDDRYPRAYESFDEDTARDDAARELRRRSYTQEGRTYLCTDDCSGHEAGFEWAGENRIRRKSGCFGDSMSFQEGCEEFVRALDRRVEERRDEWQAEQESTDREDNDY